MDLVRHLRYFLVVAEELHFGRAAARLHMSQPPLSQRIRRLEDEYRTRLFDRSGRRVRLTAAGEVLVERAREIVGRVDESYALVRRAADGTAGVLRVGVPPDTAGGLLAALSAAVADEIPGVTPEWRAATTAEQVRLLGRGGDLDVGVLQQPADTGDLGLGPVAEVAQGVVVSRNSALAAASEASLADLGGYDLALFERDAAPGRYDETLAVCARHGFRPATVRHAANPEFLLGLVAAGNAVAFDEGALARREPRVVWRPLAGSPLVWRWCAAWAGEATPAVARFGELVARVIGGGRAAASHAPPAGVPGTWDVVYARPLPPA